MDFNTSSVRGKVVTYQNNSRVNQNSRNTHRTSVKDVNNNLAVIGNNNACPSSNFKSINYGNTNQSIITSYNNNTNGFSNLNTSVMDMNIQGISALKQSCTRPADSNKSDNLTPSNQMKYDLVPLSNEIPSDGIIIYKIRNQSPNQVGISQVNANLNQPNPNQYVIYRTPEVKALNPERLNLDRRSLDFCPIIEDDINLRLVNLQNNNIRILSHLENLSNLIFLDVYNNKITSLEGSLSLMKGLRVLMLGKNRIHQISNLSNLKKLDVLDLHSNDIKVIEGLDVLKDLRVLNLAGISMISYNAFFSKLLNMIIRESINIG
jgi:Leucine-rich repeat (LRR) protein